MQNGILELIADGKVMEFAQRAEQKRFPIYCDRRLGCLPMDETAQVKGH